MTRLNRYGGRLVLTDGRRPTVELIDPNDNARRRYQYRRALDGGVEHRTLASDGTPFRDTRSPWHSYTRDELAALLAARSPILEAL